MPSTIHHLPFAYSAWVRYPRTRRFNLAGFREVAPVEVPEIDPGREVLRVVSPGCFDLCWRESGGELWRPLLDVDGSVVTDIARLARRRPDLPQADFQDHPFRLPDEGYATGVDPLKLPSMDAESPPEIRDTDRLGALARMATAGLATIEGVPYVRTGAPSWTLGGVGANAWTIGAISVAVPGHGGHRAGAACVPIDRLEDALAVREAMIRAVEAIGYENRGAAYPEPDVRVEIADGFLPPSETPGNLLRAWDRATRAAVRIPLADAGIEFAGAYAEAGRSAAALGREWSEEVEETCAEAMRALRDATTVHAAPEGEFGGAWVAIAAALEERSVSKGLDADDVATLIGLPS